MDNGRARDRGGGGGGGGDGGDNHATGTGVVSGFGEGGCKHNTTGDSDLGERNRGNERRRDKVVV